VTDRTQKPGHVYDMAQGFWEVFMAAYREKLTSPKELLFLENNSTMARGLSQKSHFSLCFGLIKLNESKFSLITIVRRPF